MKHPNDIKVVLVNIEANTERVKRQFSPPFGILCAASVLTKFNYNVIIRHLIDEVNIENVLKEICEGALAVGFSTMTSSNLLATIKATRIVKALGYYTFWGGNHATFLPEISLNEVSVDAVLRGEAESNLSQFIQWRLGKVSHKAVRGLCFKKSNGDVILDTIPPLVSEGNLAHHSFELLDLQPYFKNWLNPSATKDFINKNMIPYMTSKGCNKKCTFCYNSAVSKNSWRSYSLDIVYSEMDELIERYNVEGWLFYDDNFFVNPERAWKILARYNMPSFIEVELGRINRTFLDRAKEYNVERLFIGIESGSDAILKKIKKGINRKLIDEKVSLWRDFDIRIQLSFMILFPNESPEELEMTLGLIDELSQKKNITIAGPKIYNPYPGTYLFKELVESGWKAPTSNEEWAKFERNISPVETGFNLSEKHISILQSRGIMKS